MNTFSDTAARTDMLATLVDELTAAHEDTVRLSTAPARAIEWELHLDYLRALQRVSRAVLAHG